MELAGIPDPFVKILYNFRAPCYCRQSNRERIESRTESNEAKVEENKF